MGNRHDHWQAVYRGKPPEQVSWYQALPALSVDMVMEAGALRDTRIVDIGGGASTLVDSLLRRGHRRVAVLDVAPAALDAAKVRLGERAARVEWIVADVTAWEPPHAYDLWHDRAVFHFLTEAADRRAYVATMLRALAAEGQAIIATFAPDGPEKCSGLPVARYSPESLAAEFSGNFVLKSSRRSEHTTPAGARQPFIYCRFQRI